MFLKRVEKFIIEKSGGCWHYYRDWCQKFPNLISARFIFQEQTSNTWNKINVTNPRKLELRLLVTFLTTKNPVVAGDKVFSYKFTGKMALIRRIN